MAYECSIALHPGSRASSAADRPLREAHFCFGPIVSSDFASIPAQHVLALRALQGGLTKQRDALVVFAFLRRNKPDPPKWMTRLETATTKFALTLGLLLLGVFPSDIPHLDHRRRSPGGQARPLGRRPALHPAQLLLLALPALLVLILGNRANVFLPKARDWMNTNSWIISEIVLVFFIGITVKTLVG